MNCPNCKGKGYQLSTSWIPYKSTTTVGCERCRGTGSVAVELTHDCAPGTLVKARRLDGVTLEGVLVEWDNGTAIVNVEGRDTAIRCA